MDDEPFDGGDFGGTGTIGGAPVGFFGRPFPFDAVFSVGSGGSGSFPDLPTLFGSLVIGVPEMGSYDDDADDDGCGSGSSPILKYCVLGVGAIPCNALCCSSLTTFKCSSSFFLTISFNFWLAFVYTVSTTLSQWL